MRSKGGTAFGVLLLLVLLLGAVGRHDTPMRFTFRLALTFAILTLLGAWHLRSEWRRRCLLTAAPLMAASLLLLIAAYVALGGSAVNGPGSAGGKYYLSHRGQVRAVTPQVYYLITVLETVVFVSWPAAFALVWLEGEKGGRKNGRDAGPQRGHRPGS